MDFEEFHVRDVMKLLREIILPRLCDLEQEMQLLRKTTWPVCQAMREHYAFKIDENANISRQLKALVDPEEYRRIVHIKEEFRHRYRDKIRNSL